MSIVGIVLAAVWLLPWPLGLTLAIFCVVSGRLRRWMRHQLVGSEPQVTAKAAEPLRDTSTRTNIASHPLEPAAAGCPVA